MSKPLLLFGGKRRVFTTTVAVVVLVAALAYCTQAGATEPATPCSITVTSPIEVTALVYYEHEAELIPDGCMDGSGGDCKSAGHLYTFRLDAHLPTGTWPIYAEGFPVAVEWWAGDTMLKRCGTRPSRIMWDSFESGTLDRWKVVQ